MLAYEDLFLQVYVLIDDLLRERRVVIPARPGPQPKCPDSEVLTISSVRHLLGRRMAGASLQPAKWLSGGSPGQLAWSVSPPAGPKRVQPTCSLALGSFGTHPPGTYHRCPRRYLEPDRHERSASQTSQPTSRLRRPLAESSAESVLSARLSAMVWSQRPGSRLRPRRLAGARLQPSAR